MHARPRRWQHLGVIAMVVSCVLTGAVSAVADSEPAPKRNAGISPVPTIPEADRQISSGLRSLPEPMEQPAEAPDDAAAGPSTGGASADPGTAPVSGVAVLLDDPLNDVTAIPVPVADPSVTVAYTIEPSGDGEPEIVTTRVDGVAKARSLVAELARRPNVAAVEVDPVFAALGTTSADRWIPVAAEGSIPSAPVVVNDPERGRQWGLDALHADRVWRQATGCGQTIAVIDSGVDGEHPDLRGIVRPGKNMVSRGIGAVDRSGHGTEVAGVAAAAHGNGLGISGMAPGARVLPIGIEDAAGQMHASDLAAAIRYAIGHGATVINLSLGGPVRSSNVEYWLVRAEEAGIPVVASAGNTHDQGNATIWPAASPSTIAVGAIAPTGVWASFSSTGPHVDLTAPGVAVLTTTTGGGYTASNGTSLAAPFVSGVVALMRARDADLEPDEIRELLSETARDAGPDGRDNRFGDGIVDPLAALHTMGGTPTPCFTDTGGLTLAEQIERLGLAGITDGCAVRRFCPASGVTRGQMATFLARVVAPPATPLDPFVDVAGSPHADGINRLAAAGIAQGCSATEFCPNAPISRAQMATFISRALELPDAVEDAFADDGANVHESAINALASAEITSGCDTDHPERFCPAAGVTRAQMAAFLVRMMDHGGV